VRGWSGAVKMFVMPRRLAKRPIPPRNFAAEMKVLRQEYLDLEREWDSILQRTQEAHKSGSSPAQIIEDLRSAKVVGNEVVAALTRYRAAVKNLLHGLKAGGK
jgi:hypothetical protein